MISLTLMEQATQGATPSYSDYRSPSGANERYFALTAEPGASLECEFHSLMECYNKDSLPGYQEIFLRFHLSDITRQAPLIHSLVKHRSAFISLIGQAPANGARIAMEAWQIETRAPLRLNVNNFMTTGKLPLDNYSLILSRAHSLNSEGSYEQTKEEFSLLLNLLREEGATLKENVQRTWIYCRDIDNNYAGMVNARSELFEEHHLTKNTHYISSTGIEGQSAVPNRLVAMDSLILTGTDSEQIEHMSAPEHLSNTHVYGVTFERGTRIIYGDRSTYYISGTASIDREGDVVHAGDIARQTERTLENIKALMENHNGRLSDLKQAAIYLRDIADRDIVAEIIARSEMKNTPFIMVKAPVCRPTWLVEIDAIGVNSQGNGKFADFH